jgi:pimeloyl-ACP methyl ester carboxylesterase
MYKVGSYIKIKGKNIYYELINPSFAKKEKPFLVFLHEGLGSCRQWKDFPLIISNEVNYPALIYDRFGYGKSDVQDNPGNQNILFDEAFVILPGLLRKFRIKSPILFGHSDGGSIALLYASKFTKKVAGLVTEADHVKLEEISINEIMKTVSDFENGNLREFLSKYHGEKTDSMFYGWSNKWLSDKGRKWNIEEYLRLIRSPVLAIQGHNDQYGTVEQLSSKLKNIRGTVETLFLENCGHIPHFQAKEKVIKRTVNFILNL